MKKILAFIFVFFVLQQPAGASSWPLTSPNYDALVGWDESANSIDWFTIGTGLSVSAGREISVGDLSATYSTVGHDHSGVYQAYDADLTALAAMTDPGADRLLGWDDSATGAERVWFTIGTGLTITDTTISVGDLSAIYQTKDTDLDTASTAGAAAVSTYFGKNAAGDVGFHALPDADLGFTVDAPGASGALLQSNGTKWERVTSLTGMTFGGFSNSMAVVSDGSGNLVSDANVSATEVGYLNGLTEALPTTLAAKAPKAIVTKSTATTYTIGTTDPNEAYGGVIYVTDACTVTAPAAAAGMSFTLITVGAVAVSLDVNASDKMILDGTTLDDGDKATNTSTTGDIIVCTYYSADGWYCASGSNDGDLWTDGGA